MELGLNRCSAPASIKLGAFHKRLLQYPTSSTISQCELYNNLLLCAIKQFAIMQNIQMTHKESEWLRPFALFVRHLVSGSYGVCNRCVIFSYWPTRS